MFITTSGIVLRTYPFKDKRLVAKIFTKESGVVSFIIKKNKSQLALSQLLTIAEITYKSSKNKSLFYITETRVEHVYKSLSLNEKKIQTSIILCEILNKCLSEKNEELYDFLTNAFKCFDDLNQHIHGFDTLFLINFCKIIGISPFINMSPTKNKVLDLREGCFVDNVRGGTKNLIVPEKETSELSRLSLKDIYNLDSLQIDCEVNKKLFNYMILYISNHLADLTKLNSLRIFKEFA